MVLTDERKWDDLVFNDVEKIIVYLLFFHFLSSVFFGVCEHTFFFCTFVNSFNSFFYFY